MDPATVDTARHRRQAAARRRHVLGAALILAAAFGAGGPVSTVTLAGEPGPGPAILLSDRQPRGRLPLAPADLAARPRQLEVEVVRIDNPRNVAVGVIVDLAWQDPAGRARIGAFALFPPDTAGIYLLDPVVALAAWRAAGGARPALVFTLEPVETAAGAAVELELRARWR